MKFYHIIAIIFILNGCKSNNNSSNENLNSNNDFSYLIAYNVRVPDGTEDGGDNYDIFTMEMDGSKKTNITDNPDVAWTYHADNDKIFFISGRDTCHRCYLLYEMDANGKNVKQITDFLLRDSWMSSRKGGEELIVNPHPKVDSVFYIINRKGVILKKVNTGLPFSSDPAFSPNGKKIAFRGGTKKSKRDEGFKEELYLINEDGSGLKKLTNYPAADTTAPWYAYKAGSPKWHPVENFISYQSMQQGKYSLYAVSADGQKQWKLTENEQSEGWHDWSPDGKWLAIELFDNEQTRFYIGIMDWEKKTMEILTDTTYRLQQAPVFVNK